MFDFIVEDGTGLENSTAYCDTAFVDSYATFLGEMQWNDLSEDQKENYIIRATMFLDDLLVYQGRVLNPEQSLNWPRRPFTDGNGRSVSGLPDVIIRATAQLAIAAMEEGLTDNIPVLTSKSWGGASETYLGGYSEEESAVTMVKNMLSRLGYGESVAIVTARRA